MLWNVSSNSSNATVCVATQISWSEFFLTRLVWLVLQTQTVGRNRFLQHWSWSMCYNTGTVALTNCFCCNIGHDQCYNTNICFEMFLSTLVLLVLQHKQLVWIISCNIDKMCVTTQTVGLNCFLQHWYDLCYNTNSRSEQLFASLIWLVLQAQTNVGQELFHSNIGMCCNTTHTNVALKLFQIATLGWFVTQVIPMLLWNCFLHQLLWLVTQVINYVALNCFLTNIVMCCVTTQAFGLNCFLQQTVSLVLQHKQLVWIVTLTTLVMTCVTTQTVGLNCFLQLLVWLVLQHKPVGLNCFLQHWYDLCYTTNSLCLNYFLQHWYD